MNERTSPSRSAGHNHRTVRRAGWFASGLMVAAATVAPAVSAASVAPQPINSGNPTCASFAGGAAWTQFKLENAQLANGIYSDGTLTVTIANYADSASQVPGSFDWASNLGIDAVVVKAGSTKHNLFVYSPESTGDTALGPQAGKGNGISHISFCYDVEAADTQPEGDENPEGDTQPDEDQDTDEDQDESATETTTESTGDVAADQGGPTTVNPGVEALEPCGHGDDEVQPNTAPTGASEGAVLSATSASVVATATLPPTDTSPVVGQSQADSWRLIVLGMAALLAAALILTPSRQDRIRL